MCVFYQDKSRCTTPFLYMLYSRVKVNCQILVKDTENILIGDSVYIVGHKTPDLDAIVAAQAYQVYRHSQGDFNYIAIRCDEVNPVTKWAYKEWGMEVPPLVEDISGKKVVLVDHTDPDQRPDGWEKAEILEVIDHHKIKLETSAPPKITLRSFGSSSTIIAQKMVRRGVKINRDVAGLMLSAILDDTLALRSPITTLVDRQMAGHLAIRSQVSDISELARTLFAQKDVWQKMTPAEVCTKDSKQYAMGEKTVRISQVETMDNRKLAKNVAKYQKFMDEHREKEGLDLFIVLITDLIRNDCILLSSGQPKEIKALEEIFETKRDESGFLRLPGVLSRKKQVVPPLLQYYSSIV